MTESVLSSGDIPWEVLKRRGFESVRLMELTRFYLQLKEDPHGPNVALFVGNLPPNQNEKTYETIIRDFLDEGVLGCGSRTEILLGFYWQTSGSRRSGRSTTSTAPW